MKRQCEEISRKFQEVFGGLVDCWKKNVEPSLPQVWKDMVTIMGTIRDVYNVALQKGIEGVLNLANRWLDAMQGIQKAYEAISNFLPHTDPDLGMRRSPPVPPGSRDRWRTDPNWHVWSPTAPSPTGPIRAMTYGPLSQGATGADLRQIYGATIGGQKIRLQSGRSAAISPNLLGAYPLGSWVDEYNSKGQLIRHRRIEDTSWIRSGVPTYNTIENYNDIDIGRVQLKRSPIQGPATDTELRNARTGQGGITINYHAPVTIHGTDQTWSSVSQQPIDGI